MYCCGLNNFRYSLPPACSGCQALRGDQIVESELLGKINWPTYSKILAARGCRPSTETCQPLAAGCWQGAA